MLRLIIVVMTPTLTGVTGKIKLDYGIRWEYIIEDECVRSQCVALSTTEYVKEGVEAVVLWFRPRSSELKKEKVWYFRMKV